MSDPINAPIVAKPKRLPNKLSLLVAVPVGYVLPLGHAVEQAFNVTVEAGVRWHPDWTEPRIAVAAFRFLGQGDGLCWSGARANDLPLPEAIAALVPFHGQPLDPASAALVDAMGLGVPTKPELLAAFIARPAPYTIQ